MNQAVKKLRLHCNLDPEKSACLPDYQLALWTVAPLEDFPVDKYYYVELVDLRLTGLGGPTSVGRLMQLDTKL